uniref:Uncharacterized protein n=1 Tax=Glossina austeni TaxID=7395 RepID=A0A1A9UNH2_GLOAU
MYTYASSTVPISTSSSHSECEHMLEKSWKAIVWLQKEKRGVGKGLNQTDLWKTSSQHKYARNLSTVILVINKLFRIRQPGLNPIKGHHVLGARPFPALSFGWGSLAAPAAEGKQTQENLYLQALGSSFINSLHLFVNAEL